MKALSILAILLFTGSMALAQKQNGTISNETIAAEENVITNIKGIVRTNESCGICIEVVEEGISKMYLVENSLKGFATEGNKILFDYLELDKEGCAKIDKVVSVRNVRNQKSK